jgi:hypothetical protein
LVTARYRNATVVPEGTPVMVAFDPSVEIESTHVLPPSVVGGG